MGTSRESGKVRAGQNAVSQMDRRGHGESAGRKYSMT
jgi:hypothetical protein